MFGRSRGSIPAPHAHGDNEFLRSDEGREFVGMLAHELRNGLNDIRLLHLAAARHPTGPEIRSSGTEYDASHAIDIPLARLSLLIEDLLEYCRVTHGRFRLTLRGTDLRDVVHRAAQCGRSSLFKCRDVKLTVNLPDQPLYAIVDSDRLAMAVENLLDNALKHTPPGGEVEAAVTETGSDFIIRISDSGAGMDPEVLQQLFNPFVSGSNERDESVPGRRMGLGLFVARTIAELHGGQIYAHSRGASLGSEFSILIPRGR